MKKTFFLLLCISIVLMLSGCERESMTAEYVEETEDVNGELEDDIEDQYEDDSQDLEDTSSNYEFRDNHFREIEPDEIRTRFQAYFPPDTFKEERESIWNEICSCPEVKRTQVVTETTGQLLMDINKVHPDYYQLRLEDADENVIKSRGFIDFMIFIYTTSDVKENILSMRHDIKDNPMGLLLKEKWPIYVEEQDKLEIRYTDQLGKSQTHNITVEKISDDIPWYLDYQWTSDVCVLLLPENRYKEIFGMDEDGENMSALFGYETYYIDSKKGERENLEKKVIELTGCSDIGSCGYLMEE